MINTIDKMYHIQCVKGGMGRYVLLPGDPFRTDSIASFFNDTRLVTHNREYKTWTGYLDGVKVSMISAGTRCPSTTITLEELVECGTDAFIRMGAAGRVCDAASASELDGVINTMAVRDEGTTIHCTPIGYPAVADRRVVDTLARVAANLDHCYAEGITQPKGSFYGRREPDNIPVAARLRERWEAWQRGNMITSGVGAIAIPMISSVHGCKISSTMSFGDMEKIVRVACDVVRLLIKEDQLLPINNF